MLATTIPLDETKRLKALTTLCVLDTLPEERFDRVARLACRTFGVPIALVSIVDRDRQWFKSHPGIDRSESARSNAFCGHAIHREDAFVVRDALNDARFADAPLLLGERPMRFCAGRALHGPDGSRVGSFCVVDSKPRAFSAEDVALLADLAAMIDRELALLEGASTDELTHLCNRRGFNLVAAHVLALCRRHRLPAAAVAIDLDNFKSVNDRHGHKAGDEVLRLFAKMLHATFRGSDVLARLGGDEFAILCGGTSAERLSVMVRRLRVVFAESALARSHPTLAWSAGLANFDSASADDIDELLRAADAQMYAAKTASRRQPARAR